MTAVDIPWRRAKRHHFNVEAVEVAYSRGVPLIAYSAAVGPLCMALNRNFTGETLVDAKEQAVAYVQSAPSDLLENWHMPVNVFREAYGLAEWPIKTTER